MTTVRRIAELFRAAGRRALDEAAELEARADRITAECGGADTFIAANARFRAAVLRLGAAMVGVE